MSNTPKLLLVMVAIIIFAVAFGIGFTVGQSGPAETGVPDSVVEAWDVIVADYTRRNIIDDDTLSREDIEKLDVIGQVWSVILTGFVDRDTVNTDNLSRAAIDGMIGALDDPYTSYIEREHYQLGVSNLEGEFDGIGAYVSVDEEGQLIIIAPIAGSPADEAGIRAGDVILAVDGESVENLSLGEIIIKIRGSKGTPVTLLVLHDDESEPVEIEIIRSTVEIPSVHFEMQDTVACISITQFTERTDDELTDVLKDLDEDVTTGIILDLRGNSGGPLAAVILVTSHFLDDGIVTSMMDNHGELTEYTVQNIKPRTDLPIVVLVDNASASGSEVLAGALQDYDRAVIAGTTTFGKGSVNILQELADGSGIYITIGRWLTPDGRLIEGQGIEPDIELELTGDDAVIWAIDYLTDLD
jgi:carboxyl-terminal processing protease